MATLGTCTPKGKRTNSLAFAQADCHTCVVAGDHCDRQRPKCSTCLSKGRECGGFAMPLSWDPRRMLSFHPLSSDDQVIGEIPGREEGASGSSIGVSPSLTPSKAVPPLRFRSMMGHSVRPKKRRRRHSSQTGNVTLPESVDPEEGVTDAEELPLISEGENCGTIPNSEAANEMDSLELSDVALLSGFDFQNAEAQSMFGPPLWLDIGVQEYLFAEPLGYTSTLRSPSAAPTGAVELVPEEDLLVDLSIQELGPVSTGAMQRQAGSTLLPGASVDTPAKATMLKSSPKDYDWLFEMYDSKFCVLPLTSDTAVNPFRCKPQTWQQSRILFHAIMAICYRHLNLMSSDWFDEVDEHRRRAAQLLATELRNIQSQNCLHLLEPILILFTLDCTLSATGQWTGHLERAQLILQACGGPSSLTSPRQRSQVGMLLWWDATIALLSRRCPVLDRDYLDYLVTWEARDEWSFFDLTGCPRDLFVLLYDLTELARQCEIASSMKWLAFDISPVIDVQEKLKSWKNELDPSLGTIDSSTGEDTEKEIHEQHDRFHCAEAWRCALLLYIECVFKRDAGQRSTALRNLVRRTLDHIRCCQRSSQTQKQLLLPVFLAGSETSDEGMRAFVKDYCAYWAETSRYSMFNSVPTLLDEIWSTGVWWGTVINKMDTGPTSGGRAKATTQLLLG